MRLNFNESTILTQTLKSAQKKEFLDLLMESIEKTDDPELKKSTFKLWNKINELSENEFFKIAEQLKDQIIEGPIEIM